MTTLGQTASKADVHSEMAAYAEHINNQLKGDPALSRHLPVDGFNLISATTDGILLAKLVDSIRPGTVAVSKLNHGVDVAQLQTKEPGSKDVFKITENQNIFLEGVSKLGCKVVNVGAQDIMDGKEDLILGVVWQIIRAHLLAEINILSHPELIRLLRPDETIQTLLNLGSEQLLLRWFNYHLKRSGTPLQVSNFSEGIRDGQGYLILMQQIAPNLVDQSLVRAALEETNLDARAVALLEIAERLNCRKFVTAKDITQGHQRLNLAFTATLFNNHIGIQLPTEEEIAALFQRVDSLSSQVKTLEEALQLATLKHQELSEASTTEISSLREQVADWEQKHEVATDKALHLQSSVDLLQSQNAAHEQQIADLKQAAQDQHKAFERICGDQSNVNEEVMRQLSQAHAQITQLEASLQEETAKATQLSQRLQEQTSSAEVQLRRQQSLSTKTAKSQQEKLQAQLQQLVTLMKPEVDQAAWSTFQEASRAQSPTTEEDPTGQLLGIRWLVEQLIAQKKALAKRVAEQDGQLSRMRQMNDLMAEKVKEIAEELNQKKGTRK